jgi:hypothetical protein
MNEPEKSYEPATAEQLAILRRLGVTVSIPIDRHLAQISIEFHHATDKQLALLRRLGYSTDGPITKKQASELIEKHLKEREGQSMTWQRG